jgi:peptide/nickel transport system permease protein
VVNRVIAERLGHAVFVVFGVSLLSFLLVHLTGDPAALLLPLDATQEDRDRFSHALGLDRPLAVQYVDFLGRAAHGDFGTSLRFQQPAMGLVIERLPATLELAAVALGLALLVGSLLEFSPGCGAARCLIELPWSSRLPDSACRRSGSVLC